MGKSLEKTPTTKGDPEEKASGKKLVQARLFFKSVSSGSPSSSSGIEKKNQASASDGVNDNTAKPSSSRKRKRSPSNDSSKPQSPFTSEKNVPKQQGKDILIVLSDDNDDENTIEESSNISHSTSKEKNPECLEPKAKKRKGAGTPGSANNNKKKATSPTNKKLHIKLFSNSDKKKKRKSITSELNSSVVSLVSDSSDDSAHLSKAQNPIKRQKIAGSPNTSLNKNADVKPKEEQSKMIRSNAERDSKVDIKLKKEDEKLDNNKETKNLKNLPSKKPSIITKVTNKKDSQKDTCQLLPEVKDIAYDEELHDSNSPNKLSQPVQSVKKIVRYENDVSDVGSSNSQSDCTISTVQLNASEGSSSKIDTRVDNVVSSTKKILTPKQLRLQEQRRKLREEKERVLLEERLQKKLEKEKNDLEKKHRAQAKEEERKKLREQREEQRRKELEEKEQRRQEREEKDRKRNEAKEEELRKKEDDRKRKEQEKEEAALKKKKAAEVFSKFFVPKTTKNTDDNDQTHSDQNGRSTTNNPNVLAFRPFQVKGDMKLAPVCRKTLCPDAYKTLDSFLNKEATALAKSKLYLAELKGGKIITAKWTIALDDLSSQLSNLSDDDVQIIDSLDNVGQSIIEKTHPPLEHMKAKFYKFDENRRPAYFGTWRKRSTVIKPRRPFAQDNTMFDYEIDSDDEWEEEEPGELIDGSDDEKDKESEDDDYEVDNEWFVPHGHLSEEEMQNENDPSNGESNTREAQQAKLKVLQQEFASEMKKKTLKIKPRLVGCIWADINGNKPSTCTDLIWENLSRFSMMCAIPPLVESPGVPEIVEQSSSSPNEGAADKIIEKLKPLVISSDVLKDLAILIHGNTNSKNFLVTEFQAYLEANNKCIKSGKFSLPSKTAIRGQIEKISKWQSIEMGLNNKKKPKKFLCWIVSNDILKELSLKNLTLANSWTYTLQPKSSIRINNITQSKNELKENCSEMVEEQQKNINSDRLTPAPSSKDNSKKNIFLKLSTAAEHQSTKLQIESREPVKADDKRAAQQITKDSSIQLVGTPTVVKKRVPLLISLPRGGTISTPEKNTLISQFLKKSNTKKKEEEQGRDTSSSVV